MTSSPTDPQIQVTYLNHMGDDLTTVNAARVSFNKSSDWETSCSLCGLSGADISACVRSHMDQGDSIPCTLDHLSVRDQRLIEYLGRHGHDSPFNHNALSVHVKMPIFVARQLVKHEYLVLNEISRRYVDDKPEFYWPETWRKRAEDKKQGSSDEHVHHQGLPEWYDNALTESIIAYRTMLKAGVAPEQARMVLPLSTMTEWHWTGLLSAWAKMVNQRIQPDTQYETRLVAQQVDKIASHLWPHSWKALRSMNL